MSNPTQGVIIGGDENSAWLISWFWKYYSKHNSYPIVFVDFGLSNASKELCDTFCKRVEVSVNNTFVAGKDSVSKELILKWEEEYGENVWRSRLGWFLKPFALLQSPFDQAIWLDLDCETLGSLEPVFASLQKTQDFSVAIDPSRDGVYNSGVIVFRKNAKLVQDWATCCKENTSKFLSDDVALSSLIDPKDSSFKELIYKFHSVPGKINDDSLIIHWISNWGKQFIEMYGGFQGYKDYLLNAS